MPDQSDAEASRSLPETSIQLRLSRVVVQSLRPAAIGLCVLYVVITLSHVVFLPPATAPLMGSVAAITAGIFGLWVWRLGRVTLPVQKANTIGASFLVLAAINSFLHLFVQNDILQTTTVAFVVIATGGFAGLFEKEQLFDDIIPDLVLKGLNIALRLNT